MAVKGAEGPFGTGFSGGDRALAIVAERVSKRYPTHPVNLFPPVTSVFDRDLNPFRRKRSSDDEEATSEQPEASAEGDARRPRPRPTATQPDSDLDFEDDDLDDEEEDDELMDEGGGGRRTPWEPGEMFWALKDISFRVPRGAALGVLGGPGSGKSTLIGILGGRTFPTEGRVLVRDPVAPVPAGLARAIALTGKGTFDFDVVLAARLVGLAPQLVKPHRAEIEAMAAPLRTEEGEPAPGALLRLAIATAVVVPASVLLIEDSPGIDEAFMEEIAQRIPDRLRDGSSLVLASRKPELISRLCDEAISLSDGEIAESGNGKGVAQGYVTAAGSGGRSANGSSAGRRSGRLAPSRHLSDNRRVQVPDVVPAFNGFAALMSATLNTPRGRSKRIDSAADEVEVEIRFETAQPDVEAHVGVVFTPRHGDGPGIRLELPEPLRFVDPRNYRLVARTLPGVLPVGDYKARADAIVANPKERGATVIARDIGRVVVVGNEFDPDEYEEQESELREPPIVHWDGRQASRVEADWSIE